MKAVITDAATLRAIPLADVEIYLRSKGWVRLEPTLGKLSSWVLSAPSSSPFELYLPTESTVADYATRLSEVLQWLEQLESRSQIAIVRDISFSSADVIRITRPIDDDAEQSIALHEGVALVEHARDLMTSVACAAVQPRRIIPPRRPPQAIDYLQRARLGHTEQGSYVVTIISRVAPLLTPGAPGLEELMEEPFPRLVTLTLAKALTATEQAALDAARTGTLEPFEKAIPAGVSADLCEAIVGLCRSGGATRPVAIDIAWAPSRPAAPSQFARKTFTPTTAEVIEEAARHFRATSPLEGAGVVGVVVNLHRDADAEEGSATIAGVVDETPRQVVLRLTATDYNIAIEAHRNKQAVTFTADIEKLGRAFTARNIANFRKLD